MMNPKQSRLIDSNMVAFVRESLKIEGILREPTGAELEAISLFVRLESVPTIAHLRTLVGVFEPTAQLREHKGLDVQIGSHVPMRGGIMVATNLAVILENASSLGPHTTHLDYEHLHPFTDCNGRSGRALWAWGKIRQGYDLRRAFLHEMYYDTLSAYHGA